MKINIYQIIKMDSDYKVRLATLEALGGDTTKDYASVYDVDLAILKILEQGVGAQIDDEHVSTETVWSSAKVVAELADAGFNVQVVQQLPATGDPHTIYFVPSSDPQTGNTYDEFLYVDGGWEQVGSTAIDMSDYYTKSEVDDLLEDKAEIVELTQAEYDALPTATKNDGRIYSITDAVIINPLTKTEADGYYNPKLSTTANQSGYKFPAWNANGQITGYFAQAYQASQSINGSSRVIYSNTNTAMPAIFAPTTAGTRGYYLVSNGSGAPIWQELEVASDYVISDADAAAGTYSADIAAFYTKTIGEGIVQGVQIKITEAHVIHEGEPEEETVYSDSFYLPSSSRIYEGNVELWLMSTEDGETWENIYYLITGNSITRTVTTGTFGPTDYVKTVTLTQAEYDALLVKDPYTLYVISDAQ